VRKKRSGIGEEAELLNRRPTAQSSQWKGWRWWQSNEVKFEGVKRAAAASNRNRRLSGAISPIEAASVHPPRKLKDKLSNCSKKQTKII
jgi:hypothetical protein